MALTATSASVDTQLELLAWLHWIWAGFNAIVAVAMGTSAAAALMLADAGAAAADVAASVTAGAFIIVALAALTWGAAHAWCGRALRARAPAGRFAALALALFNTLLFPLGTLLAAYTAWLLLQNPGRARFTGP